MKNISFTVFLMLLPAHSAHAWVSAPRDQGECARKYVSNVSDKDTADILAMACIGYFRTQEKLEKSFFQCLIEDASKSKNYSATQVIALGCLERYPISLPKKK